MKLKIIETVKTIVRCFILLWKVDFFYFIVRLIGKIISPVNVVILSLLLKEIFNFFVEIQPGKIRNIFIYIVLYSLFRIINTAFTSVIEYTSDMEGEKLEKYIKNMVIVTGTQSDIEAFDNVEYHNKMLYMKSNYHVIITVAWQAIDCLAGLISFITIFTIMFRYDWVSAILIVIACVPSGVMRKKYTKMLYDFNLEQLNNSRRKEYFIEIATNRQFTQDVRLYNMSCMLVQKYNSLWNDIFSKRKRIIKKQTIITVIMLCIPEIIFLCTMLNVGKRIIQGILSIGDYSLYIGLLSQLWGNIIMVISSVTAIWENKMKLDYIADFGKINKKIIDGEEYFDEEINEIEFISVKSKYPFSDNYILNDFNLKIKKKEKIAVVGLNGAGKSTMIKLLLRFYDVNSGKILINGSDIKKYTLESIRKQFSLYFQESQNYLSKVV